MRDQFGKGSACVDVLSRLQRAIRGGLKISRKVRKKHNARVRRQNRCDSDHMPHTCMTAMATLAQSETQCASLATGEAEEQVGVGDEVGEVVALGVVVVEWSRLVDLLVLQRGKDSEVRRGISPQRLDRNERRAAVDIVSKTRSPSVGTSSECSNPCRDSLFLRITSFLRRPHVSSQPAIFGATVWIELLPVKNDTTSWCVWCYGAPCCWVYYQRTSSVLIDRERVHFHPAGIWHR